MVNACFLEMGLTMYLSNLLLPCFASVFSVIFEVIKLQGINVTLQSGAYRGGLSICLDSPLFGAEGAENLGFCPKIRVFGPFFGNFLP